jgi:YVTN family beta-propeller protein
MRILLLLNFLAFPFLLFSQQNSVPKEVSIDSTAFATLKLPGSPDFLAPDGDDVWILNIDRVEKLSAKQKTPVLSVPVPGACGAMIVGFKSLWVASCGKQAVYRIDKRTGKILSVISCGISDKDGEIMLATGDGSLWVLSDSSGVLTRISAKTNTIQTLIPVLPNSHCAVFDFNSVWITNTKANSVQRIDPKTNKIAATINVGKTPRFLAAGEKGVWTFNQGDGTVSHIDPEQNKVIAIVDTKVPGGGGDIATGAGRVWVRATKGRFLQTINPVANTVETIYTPVSGSGAVRVTKHFIWVTAHDINTIWVLKR